MGVSWIVLGSFRCAAVSLCGNLNASSTTGSLASNLGEGNFLDALAFNSISIGLMTNCWDALEMIKRFLVGSIKVRLKNRQAILWIEKEFLLVL